MHHLFQSVRDNKRSHSSFLLSYKRLLAKLLDVDKSVLSIIIQFHYLGHHEKLLVAISARDSGKTGK